MANFDKINKEYIQTGPACVLTSYSIIMNYFSDNRISIEETFSNFINSFEGEEPADEEERDCLLCKLYHVNCPQNKRGFEQLADWHNDNRMKTEHYCSIKEVKAEISSLDKNIVDKLRVDLQNSDTLAMVLMTEKDHVIVLGYDDEEGYFLRNPQKYESNDILSKDDFLSENDIREFILFERV